MVIKLSSMFSKKTFALPKKRLWIHYTGELQSVLALAALTRGVPQIGTPVTHDHSGVAARIAGKKASQTTSLDASNLLTHLGEMLNHPICRDNSRGRERARESRPIFKSSKRRIAQRSLTSGTPDGLRQNTGLDQSRRSDRYRLTASLRSLCNARHGGPEFL